MTITFAPGFGGKKDFGTVTFGGTEVHLLQDAYPDDEVGAESNSWSALAEDGEGNKYVVKWIFDYVEPEDAGGYPWGRVASVTPI
jgi:hypothetical protein